MLAMTFEATVAADGMLHLAVPCAPPGSEVEVSISPKPTAKADNGWPAGFHEKMFGCITDETFVRHPQPPLQISTAIAAKMYDSREFSAMPILADALE